MSKTIEQFIDEHGHLVEFIEPCHGGQVLARWFTDTQRIVRLQLTQAGLSPFALKTQQLLPKDSANWVKAGLRRGGYHLT